MRSTRQSGVDATQLVYYIVIASFAFVLQRMPTVTVRLTDEMSSWIESQLRPFHKKSDVIRDLIVSQMNGLTGVARLPAYRVGAGTQLSSSSLDLDQVDSDESTKKQAKEELKEKQKNKRVSNSKRKNVEPDSFLVHNAFFETTELHPQLEPCREAFVHFGKVKKGDRGQHGAKLAATGLRKIGEKYGWEAAREQLDLAINNRWNGITLSNYEKFAPKSIVAALESPRHPASRVFTADHGFENEGNIPADSILGGLL
jgi:Arc/MetJ-type ribon-helix-helix transcriptional regulator